MVLAVDLGQTGTRLLWDDGHFESNRAKRANESSLDALRDVFEEVTQTYGDSIRSQIVALSVTGLYGHVPDPTPYGELVEEFFRASAAAVIDDGLAGLIGALGEREGVALSVGSGVVAVAIHQGALSHADGLGHVFGDIGGGFWLGNRALQRALATRQGRADDHHLLDFLNYEISKFDELESNTDAAANSLCITTARRVLEGAESGIVGAKEIRDEGARELANTVSAAWVGAGGGKRDEFSLALLGGLSRNRGYEDAISQNVLRLLPNAHVVNVTGNNLDGAMAIVRTMTEDRPPLLRWWRKE